MRAMASRDFSPPESARIFLSTSSPENWNAPARFRNDPRSEEQRLNSSHPSISYAVFCLKKQTVARVQILPAPGLCQPCAVRLEINVERRGRTVVFFNNPAPPEIYPLSLPDPLPI